VVNRRWPTTSQYPRTTTGVKKAITLDRVRWPRWRGTDARPCALKAGGTLCEQRGASPQGPAHLVFHPPHVSLLSPIDPLACTPKLYLNWHSFTIIVCVRQHTGIFASPVFSERIHDLKILSPPVNLRPTSSLATSFCAFNDYYLCPVCLTQLFRRLINAGIQLTAMPPHSYLLALQ